MPPVPLVIGAVTNWASSRYSSSVADSVFKAKTYAGVGGFPDGPPGPRRGEGRIGRFQSAFVEIEIAGIDDVCGRQSVRQIARIGAKLLGLVVSAVLGRC